MKPSIIAVERSNPARALLEAARVIRAGGLVAYPTESFYALGADGLDAKAVESVFMAKGRREDNPVPLIVHDREALLAVAGDVSREALDAVERLAPGPVTFVLRAGGGVPPQVTAGTGRVGVRIPADPLMRELARLSGVPVVATSANVSGMPGLTDPLDVAGALGGSVDLILDCGKTPGPPPSTVLDISVWPPVIIREGRLLTHEISLILGV